MQALTAAGNAQDKLEFSRLVEDLGTRTGQAAEQAAAQTAAVVEQAAAGMQKAAADARQAVLDAQHAARRDFADQIQQTQTSIEAELARTFGGDDPALVTRLRPLLDRFAADLQRTGVDETAKLIAQTSRLFDVDDPTSPLAKQAALLQRHQNEAQAAQLQRSRDLEARIADLTTSVERAFAAKQAADQAIQKTAAKGLPYEAAVHTVMHSMAAGLGDTYAETGTTTGVVNRSKKGDGVLSSPVDGFALVLEMTSGDRNDWVDYLDEAERNRTAQASLGLVRDPSQLHGQTILCLGPRRIVMAFDPEQDDPALLRTVVQLLRLAARTAVRQQQGGSLDAVDDKLAEAITHLDAIAGIQKAANLTRQHAHTVLVGVEALRDNLERALAQARTALAAVEDDDLPAAA